MTFPSPFVSIGEGGLLEGVLHLQLLGPWRGHLLVANLKGSQILRFFGSIAYLRLAF